MCKVLSEFTVADKYKVLAVDEEPPVTESRHYIIGGKQYTPVVAYDMPFGIAIPNTDESLVGKEVIFS
ncbi:MAG: hypothetical protein J5518_11470 [Lachnospiraceae bacterium]|nr:hypothetical protein [Lachnospiraceae bacterium]